MTKSKRRSTRRRPSLREELDHAIGILGTIEEGIEPSTSRP